MSENQGKMKIFFGDCGFSSQNVRIRAVLFSIFRVLPWEAFRMSANWKELETRIVTSVKTERRPVGVTFLSAVPAGVTRFEGTEPSGCSFWRLAATGKVF